MATNIRADDGWTEVISDPKESPFTADIRYVYARDDGKNWSFKVVSWDDWKLSRNGGLRLYFNTSCTSKLKDSDYTILIFGEGSSFTGLLYDMFADEFYEIDCDFNANNATGTFSIAKNILKALIAVLQ